MSARGQQNDIVRIENSALKIGFALAIEIHTDLAGFYE
jgi:hypothetical protein